MAEDREFARIQLVKNHAATTVALANAEIELYRARNDARPVSPILVNKPAIGVSQPAQAAPSNTDAQSPATVNSPKNDQNQSLAVATSQPDAAPTNAQVSLTTETQPSSTRYRYGPFNSPTLHTATSQQTPSSQSNIFAQAASVQVSTAPTPLPSSTNTLGQMQPFTPHFQPSGLIASAQYGQPNVNPSRPVLFGNQLTGLSRSAPKLLPQPPGLSPFQGRPQNMLAKRDPAVVTPKPSTQDSLQRPQTRKRSPSIEITDQRKRKQAREEQDHVRTPPLNEEDEEPEDEDMSSPSERSFSQKQKRGVASRGTSTRNLSQRQTSQNASWQRPPGTISHSRQRHPPLYRPSPRRAIDENYDDEVEEEVVSRTTQHQRIMSGTPQVIAEGHYESSDDESGTTNYAGRLRKNRKQPGEQYYPTFGEPLTTSDRKAIEMRFAAKIGKMIGSKICLSNPPKPADTKSIATRIKARFGGIPGEEDERYHTVQDFDRDVRSMLRMYTDLGGPCGKCRFKSKGSDRIMCYRYRMQSVVDQRLRMLPDCIRACELEVDPTLEPMKAQEARIKKVDEYFRDQDFEPDDHWDGTRR